jgi:hypothetical protein
MNISRKAVLLSALVLPGAGHFFLKRYVVGAVLAGTALTALYLVIANTVERALRIAQQIQNGEVPLDVAVIAELVSTQTTADAQSLDIAVAVLTVVWVGAIVDSYRVARQKNGK